MVVVGGQLWMGDGNIHVSSIIHVRQGIFYLNGLFLIFLMVNYVP